MASIGDVITGVAGGGGYRFADEEDEEMGIDARHVAPNQLNRDENLVKKEEGNRPALREIGNLVRNHPKEGGKLQPQNNLTKKLGALSLADDPVPTENKPKNQHEEAVGEKVPANVILLEREAAVIKKVRVQKKVTYKPEPETVIVISSDEEDSSDNDQKKMVLSSNKGDRKHGGSSRKKVHSLTSVLTARSKAACGLTSEEKSLVVDIDAGDVNNELAVVDYVEELYKFYKLAEEENRIRDYMKWQPNINEKMRMILIDWLVEVHDKFDLMPESLYLTIDIIDRFLSKKVVSRKELQLVGISSLLLACKYEEIWAPEVNDLVVISEMAYSHEKVLRMEKTILEHLEWNLTVATPYVFLVRFIKATFPSDKQLENMTFFLAETGLLHYPIVVSYRPSMIAAAAVYAALRVLNRKPDWTKTLQHYTGYTEEELKECGQMLEKFHSGAPSKLKAIYRKYLS